MPLEYRKNAIYTGHVDFYCLVCECHMRSERDTDTHIEKPIHRKNLDLYPYLDNYQHDRIRKIKMLYYCELCNTILPTAAKVTLHTVKETHSHKRGVQHIKRFGNHVVVNEILIKHSVWNGIVSGTCVVCDTEFEDGDIHLAEQKHVLNVIGKEIMFIGEDVYRKIDESSFHCLVCNVLFSIVTMSTHSEHDLHKIELEKCRLHFKNNVSQNYLKNSKVFGEMNNQKEDKDVSKDQRNTNTLKINNNHNNKTTNADKVETNDCLIAVKKDEILENVIELEKSHGININFETDVVSCKQCSETMNFDIESIEKHTAEHRDNVKKNTTRNVNNVVERDHCITDLYNKNGTQYKNCEGIDNQDETTKAIKSENEKGEEMLKIDVARRSNSVESDSSDSYISANEDVLEAGPSTDRSDVKLEEASFAKDHQITYNFGKSNAYCRTCEVKMPSHLKSMKEHVDGAKHKTKVNTLKSNISRNKVPLSSFITHEAWRGRGKSLFFNEPIDDVVVDKKLCVPTLSFNLITSGNYNKRCQICEKNLLESELEDHTDGWLHERRLMLNIPVLMTYPSEFIREVRTDVYHCGFCNLMVGDWYDLGRHLLCSDHKRNKNFCEIRLATHLREERAQKARQELAFLSLFLRGPFNRFTED